MTPNAEDVFTARLRRFAMAGIVALFLALIRTLGQIYWMRVSHPLGIPLMAADVWVMGALIAAIGCFIATLLYFARAYLSTIFAAIVTVGMLVAYRYVVFR